MNNQICSDAMRKQLKKILDRNGRREKAERVRQTLIAIKNRVAPLKGEGEIMWEKKTSGSYIDENGNPVEWEQVESGLHWYDYILQIRWGGWRFVVGLLIAPFLILRDAFKKKGKNDDDISAT